MTVIDCTQSPPFDAMRAAGVTGVVRYLAYVQPSTDFKRVKQPEFDGLRNAGFDVVLNWEMAATDWLGGSSAGAAHAAEAVRQAVALGYPAGCAIPGSCDFNITAAQWQSAGRAYAVAYARGIINGGYIAGVYGPWDVLTWCQQLGGFGMFWQAGMSTSWSGGRNANPWPGAHLRQRRVGSIAGYDVDFNDQLQTWYGQYGVDAASTGGIVDFTPDDDNAWQQGNRTAALLHMTDVPGTTAIPAGEPNALAAALRDIQSKVDAAGGLSDADRALLQSVVDSNAALKASVDALNSRLSTP